MYQTRIYILWLLYLQEEIFTVYKMQQTLQSLSNYFFVREMWSWCVKTRLYFLTSQNGYDCFSHLVCDVRHTKLAAWSWWQSKIQYLLSGSCCSCWLSWQGNAHFLPEVEGSHPIGTSEEKLKVTDRPYFWCWRNQMCKAVA